MRYMMLLIFTAICFGIGVMGCGGGGDESASETQTASEEGNMIADISQFSAGVSGTIHFNGTAPKRRPIRQDRECRVLHEEPPLTKEVVVNENGTLKNVFVYIKEGLGDKQFAPSSEPVEFDQNGCIYKPHVFGIQTGQTLKILNSDPLLHNIHALPTKNRPFNFGMPNKGDVRERSFQIPEVMVRIKCDVHPWMGAYAGVLSHPYFAVSGDDGTFTIKNLPAGEYVIETWHEKYGTQTQTITVGKNETKTVDFTYGKEQAAS